jgi:hypothetical protein
LTLLGLALLPLSSVAEAAPFQLYKNGTCTPSLICTIDFPAVPANKRLEITNASCYLRVNGNHDLAAMQLLVMQGTIVRSAVTLVPSRVDNIGGPTPAMYGASHSIFAFANGGQRFRAYAELAQGTFGQFACHISGQMQNEL